MEREREEITEKQEQLARGVESLVKEYPCDDLEVTIDIIFDESIWRRVPGQWGMKDGFIGNHLDTLRFEECDKKICRASLRRDDSRPEA